MKISVFTPLTKNGNPYIESVFDSLRAQTHEDWEWVVLENHGGELPKKLRTHPKVRCFGDSTREGIGALKRRCCELSQGDVLLELDHDDLLHPDALLRCAEAIDSGADFVYSDTAEFHDKTWQPNHYSSAFGWHTYEVEFQGHKLLAHHQPPATPQNIRKVEWSPNHFRAWRTEAYWRVGGHDASLPVIDDHDLVVRSYLMGLKFHHVKECLYFYRVHGSQTVQVQNARIQEIDWQIYDRTILNLATRFANDSGLKKIDLCGAIDTYEDFEPLDIALGHDLNQRWPLEDNSVGVIRANDAIEHLKDPIHVMTEAYRVLAPGGFFLIKVPSTDGRGAWQDPTHISFWNANSFWYYTQANLQRYIKHAMGERQARFQVSKLLAYFPEPQQYHRNNHIPYVDAHLIALKDGYEPYGVVEI